MPRNYTLGAPTPPQAAEPQKPLSMWEKLANLAAGGVRVGSGLLSSEGGVPGALTSGAGEGLAEVIEGSAFKQPFKKTLTRMGVESGIGAIPFGKLISGGKFLASAAKTGAMSGVGEAGREWANDQPMDKPSIALATLLGGGIGGTVGKFMGGHTPTPPVRVPEPMPTGMGNLVTQTGDIVKRGPVPLGDPLEKAANATTGKMAETAAQAAAKNAKALPKSVPYDMPLELNPDRVASQPFKGKTPTVKNVMRNEVDAAKAQELVNKGKAAVNQGKGAEEDKQVDLLLKFLSGKEAQKTKDIVAKETAQQTALDMSRKSNKEQAKPLQDLFAEIKVGKMKQDLKKGPAHVTESASFPTSTGKTGGSQSWVEPVEDDVLGGGGKARNVGQPVGPVGPNGEPLDYRAAAAQRVAASRVPVSDAAKQALQQVETSLGGAKTTSQQIAEQEVADFAKVRGTPADVAHSPKAQAMEADRVGNGPVPYIPDINEAPPVPESPLLQLLTNKMDVIGGHYKDVQAAAKGAEKGSPLQVGARTAGKGLQRSAKEAGLPTRGGPPASPGSTIPPPVDAEVIPAGPASPALSESGEPFAPSTAPPLNKGRLQDRQNWIKKGYDELQQLLREKAAGSKLGGEGGGIDPALAVRLGLGAGGAVLGAETDPLGDPTMSAAAGAGVGLGSPEIARVLLKGMRVPEHKIQEMVDTIGQPGGLKTAATKIAELFASYQRFNLLGSPTGLAANAFAGPYGANLTGAIESVLKGDPRGMTLLKELNPVSFIGRGKEAFPEAIGAIGRAEGKALAESGNNAERALALPGIAMTTYDVVARKLAKLAGYSEDEARVMTLTNEPGTSGGPVANLMKRIAGFGRGNPLGQVLFPFSRTPANLFEQGLDRIPGVGVLTNAVKDPAFRSSVKDQLVEQGLGAGIIGANYVAGENLDPDSARVARRFTTNLAGRHSLGAALGMALGQAKREGKPLSSATGQVINNLPLPSAQPAMELNNFLFGNAAGDHPTPRGLQFAPGHWPDDPLVQKIMKMLEDEGSSSTGIAPVETGRRNYILGGGS